MISTQNLLNAYDAFSRKYTKMEQHYNKVCTWSLMNEDNSLSIFETECGNAWEFIEGSWQENGVIYCPYCGGKIAKDRNE